MFVCVAGHRVHHCRHHWRSRRHALDWDNLDMLEHLQGFVNYSFIDVRLDLETLRWWKYAGMFYSETRFLYILTAFSKDRQTRKNYARLTNEIFSASLQIFSWPRSTHVQVCHLCLGMIIDCPHKIFDIKVSVAGHICWQYDTIMLVYFCVLLWEKNICLCVECNKFYDTVLGFL